MSSDFIIDIKELYRFQIADHLNSIKKWTGSTRGSNYSKTHFVSAC